MDFFDLNEHNGELASLEQRALREFWFLQRSEPLTSLLWGQILAVARFDVPWGSKEEYPEARRNNDLSRLAADSRDAAFHGVTVDGVEFVDILESWAFEYPGLRVELAHTYAGDVRRLGIGFAVAALPLEVVRLLCAGAWTHFAAGGRLHRAQRRSMATFIAGREAEFALYY